MTYPNPFFLLPKNTSRIFVVEKTLGGCEIYLPVANDAEIKTKKAELRTFLDNQCIPIEPLVA